MFCDRRPVSGEEHDSGSHSHARRDAQSPERARKPTLLSASILSGLCMTCCARNGSMGRAAAAMGQSARLCLGPALSGAQYFYQQLVEVARDRRSKRS